MTDISRKILLVTAGGSPITVREIESRLAQIKAAGAASDSVLSWGYNANNLDEELYFEVMIDPATMTIDQLIVEAIGSSQSSSRAWDEIVARARRSES